MSYNYSFSNSQSANKSTIIISVILHIVVFLLIIYSPYLFVKKKRIIHTKSFELVGVEINRKKPVVVKKRKLAPVKKKVVSPKVKQKKITAPVLQTKPKQKTVTKPIVEPEQETEPLLPTQVDVQNKNFKYDWYLSHISSKVERNWNPPQGLPGDKDLTVVVFFKISKSGNITDLKIKESSGVQMLDNLGIRCIKRSSPFPRLPPRFLDDELVVTFKLNYIR